MIVGRGILWRIKMPYSVEINRATGKMRLSYVATIRRKNIGKKGELNRSIIGTMNGLRYHATKGVRDRKVWDRKVWG
jgi:hypothetical protein